ncbi:pyrroline-5-carboxylate reductase [Aggregatibacter actinomycetemcomitans serotype b str. I23C]|nr:pyrroline-5-carboxylate reductase [Aggregatibacter actinomycetemcomitans serotype b str. I23C]
MQHKLVTFIGGGNMAQAIVFGLLKRGYPADKIIVCDPNEEKRDLFAQKGVRTATDNVAAAMQADVVLLAVKPQMLVAVCAPLSAVDFQAKLVISIAAGSSLARLTALLRRICWPPWAKPCGLIRKKKCTALPPPQAAARCIFFSCWKPCNKV